MGKGWKFERKLTVLFTSLVSVARGEGGALIWFNTKQKKHMRLWPSLNVGGGGKRGPAVRRLSTNYDFQRDVLEEMRRRWKAGHFLASKGRCITKSGSRDREEKGLRKKKRLPSDWRETLRHSQGPESRNILQRGNGAALNPRRTKGCGKKRNRAVYWDLEALWG